MAPRRPARVAQIVARLSRRTDQIPVPCAAYTGQHRRPATPLEHRQPTHDGSALNSAWPVAGKRAGDDGSGSCRFVQSPFCLISIMRQGRRRTGRLAADGDGTSHPVAMACGHWPRLPGSTSASSRPGHRAARSVACQSRSSAIRARRWRLSRRGRVAGAAKI